MGWITFHETRSAKQYFTDMVNDCKGVELVDIAIVNFRTAYLAIKDIEKGYVYCGVYLLHRSPKEYHNFGYKDLSEFSGPCQTDCPKRIIDKLSSLDEIKLAEPDWNIEFAKNWRIAVLARLETIANQKKAAKKGYIFKTFNPIGFGNGMYEFQYFVKEGRKIFGLLNYGKSEQFRQQKVQVRFRGWKNQEFEIIVK